MNYFISYKTQKSLVESLLKQKVIKTPKVAEVMKLVDRKHFMHLEEYYDSPSPIGYNATISAPHMYAYALELVHEKLAENECKVLDVGSGSGCLTLCMSLMNSSQGTVVGVEHISELVTISKNNIRNAGYGNLIDEGKIIITEGDGRLGYEDLSPYDVIHVGAAAADVPQALIDQLKNGGELLMPVGRYQQTFKKIKKVNGKLIENNICEVSYVPLTDKRKQI